MVVEMFRQLRSLMCACLLLLLIPAMAAQGETIVVSEEIQVEGWPDPLVLKYGETKDFTIDVRNTGDRTLGIYMEWTSCDCPYGHSGSVSERYIVLGAGESEEVTVTVTSGSEMGGDNDGEGMLTFQWGPDLTMVNGRPDDLTIEDHEAIDLDVQDDVATSYLGLIAVITILVVVIVGTLVILRMRSRTKRESE
jgi:uncharacterized membrane protein